MSSLFQSFCDSSLMSGAENLAGKERKRVIITHSVANVPHKAVYVGSEGKEYLFVWRAKSRINGTYAIDDNNFSVQNNGRSTYVMYTHQREGLSIADPKLLPKNAYMSQDVRDELEKSYKKFNSILRSKRL